MKIFNKFDTKMNTKMTPKKVNMHIPLPVSNNTNIGTHFACISPYEPWRKK